MKATLYNDLIELSFIYHPLTISRIKTLDSRKYDPKSQSWFIPLKDSGESVKKLSQWGFYIDPLISEAVDYDIKQVQEAEALLVMSDVEFKTSLPLYPYQRVGTAFLDKIGSGILGDEPGMGKTLMALALIEKNKAEKVLILCPAVLKYQWASEIEKFLPKSSTIVVDGSADNRLKLWTSEARFYVANYELLLRDFVHINIREWNYIIADECTRISNPRAKQSKAIKKLRGKHKIAMSGTPISNRAQDCWNLVDFCQSGAFGNYWNFLNRYCVKNQWGSIFAYQNIEELRGKLKRYMIRRLKQDVLPELPERIETEVPFLLSDEERELQLKIKKELLFEIDKKDISKIDKPMNLAYTIAKFQRLRMLADSLELIGENKKSSKLEVLKELMNELKETNRKIIIFSEFAEMCKILKREYPEALMIIGETSDHKRKEVVESFNNDLTKKILIMSSAGMFGLNLQVADTIINYDLPFSLAKLEQRIGRAHRIGQKNNVMVYHLLGKGTADMAIRKIIHTKSELSEQLLSDKPITMDDMREVLSYND